MEDPITGTDVWQEGISQAFPLVCPFHQTSNVHHIQVGRNFTVNQKILKWQGLDIKKYKAWQWAIQGLT